MAGRTDAAQSRPQPPDTPGVCNHGLAVIGPLSCCCRGPTPVPAHGEYRDTDLDGTRAARGARGLKLHPWLTPLRALRRAPSRYGSLIAIDTCPLARRVQ